MLALLAAVGSLALLTTANAVYLSSDDDDANFDYCGIPTWGMYVHAEPV